jgi:AraC family transcriptional activator of tynA and feaB
MEVVFSADAYDTQDRYNRFQEIVADHTGVFEVQPHDRSCLNTRVLGLIREPFTFNAFSAFREPLVITRPKRLIRPEDTNSYWVTAVTVGEWSVRLDDGDITMQPGEIIIFDPADEVAVNYQPFGPDAECTIINITMPKHLLTSSSGALPARFPLYIPLANPMSTILFGMIHHICMRSAQLTDGHIERVMDRLADILCETVLDNFKYRDQHQTYQSTHLWLAKATIENRLYDPGLDAQFVAASIGKTVDYVQDMFRSENTSFADWVGSRRLERLRAEFERPDRLNESVDKIAAQWGFSDVTSMSRDLNAKFGLDVADFRATARIRAVSSSRVS